MPALAPTDIAGRITWLGTVPDRDVALASRAKDRMTLTFAGPPNEAHGGVTRPSCSRVLAIYDRDTDIKNVRQLSVVSTEELASIADAMGLDRVDPSWLGATMVLSGVPDLSHLPPSARLQFRGRGGPTVTVDMQNRPCNLPAKVIDAERPGYGRSFKAAADKRRGVTAWVEREGEVSVGDAVRVFVPDQRAWRSA